MQINLMFKMDELNGIVKDELRKLTILVSKNSMEGDLCHARCCIEHCGKCCSTRCKRWCYQHSSRIFLVSLFVIGSILVVCASIISRDTVVILSLSGSFFLSSVSIFSLWCRPQNGDFIGQIEKDLQNFSWSCCFR